MVPDVLLGGIGELPEIKDPLFFFEYCPVRGAGAAVAGAAMGLLFGAFFSGYGALTPYDPANAHWQQSMAHLKQAPSNTAHVPLETLARPSGSSLASAARSVAAASPALASAAASVSAAASAASASAAAAAANVPGASLATAFAQGLSEMKTKSISSAKNFGMVGAVYTTIECTVEKVRGKRDMKNAVTAGFATGAVLAAQAGPSAMIVGGAGFAAFSVVIELLSPMLFDH
jgi:hypothetical protein